jgi:hypothetical protein
MSMTEKIFGYEIRYGKALRAKQRAWKMIYMGTRRRGMSSCQCCSMQSKQLIQAYIMSTS